MVLDTFQQFDMMSLIHPLVMNTATSSSAHTTTTTTTTAASTSTTTAATASIGDDFEQWLAGIFCDDETFAAYCTVTRNADGTETKSISSENLGELVGIGLLVILIILLYLVVAVVGIFAFPPIVICLAMEAGDLNVCSAGLFK